MRYTLASFFFFLVVSSLALACEAVTHANDFSAAAICATGTLSCGGRCVAEDSTNCSACGVGCSGGQVCSNGSCGSQCSDNLLLCGTLCVDIETDPANCGRCGGPADGGACPFCQDGVCQSQCAAPSVVCGGKCVDTTSDQNNCGACSNQCKGATPICDKSNCVASCGSGETECNHGCADYNQDPNDCGGCHTSLNDPYKCPAPPLANPITGVAACVLGRCVVACAEGLTYCLEDSGPVCVDVTSNAKHCGSCAHSCLNGGVVGTCVAGNCVDPP